MRRQGLYCLASPRSARGLMLAALKSGYRALISPELCQSNWAATFRVIRGHVDASTVVPERSPFNIGLVAIIFALCRSFSVAETIVTDEVIPLGSRSSCKQVLPKEPMTTLRSKR